MARSPQRTVLFLALLLFLAAPLAAARRWVPLGGPYGGGWIRQIVVAPSDARVVYAVAGYDILFKSTDGGGNWFALRRFEYVRSIAVDPARPSTIYVATIYELFKSVDGGASWNEMGPRSADSVNAVAVDPARASRVYAGGWGIGGSGIWFSTNRGASWQPAQSPLPSEVTQLIAARQPIGTVFAITRRGVYKSVDAGLTWRASLQPAGADDFEAFAVAPSDSRWLYASFRGVGLFRSADRGATWQPTGRQPVTDDWILSLAVSPHSPRTLWLVTERRGLFRSKDGGDTWTAGGLTLAANVAAVAVAPSSSGTVYAGLWPRGTDVGGVFASTDGGGTWVRRNRGLSGLAVALALDPGNPGILWAGHRGGLYCSANAGKRWVRMALPPTSGYSFRSIVVDPTASSTIYVLGDSLWRTVDGGASWTDLFATGPHPSLRRLWVAPRDPSRLWGIGGAYSRRLFTSADGGGHWDRLAVPRAQCGLYDLAFAPSSPSTLYAAGSGTYPDASCVSEASAVFFRSSDGGATWSDLSSGLRPSGFDIAGPIAVDPVDPRLVYLGTSGESPWGWCAGVQKSTDGGTTWAQAGEDIGCITAVAASPVAGVVWAANAEGRVFRSGNAGATWKSRTDGLPARWVYDLVIDPSDPSRIYAVTSSGVWVWTEDAF